MTIDSIYNTISELVFDIVLHILRLFCETALMAKVFLAFFFERQRSVESKKQIHLLRRIQLLYQ